MIQSSLSIISLKKLILINFSNKQKHFPETRQGLLGHPKDFGHLLRKKTCDTSGSTAEGRLLAILVAIGMIIRKFQIRKYRVIQ
jgi:hypothetical protein